MVVGADATRGWTSAVATAGGATTACGAAAACDGATSGASRTLAGATTATAALANNPVNAPLPGAIHLPASEAIVVTA